MPHTLRVAVRILASDLFIHDCACLSLSHVAGDPVPCVTHLTHHMYVERSACDSICVESRYNMHLVQILVPCLYVSQEIQSRLSRLIDRMKTSAAPARVIVVGGGAALCSLEPTSLDGDGDYMCGVCEVVRPAHAEVANAVGAAIPQASVNACVCVCKACPCLCIHASADSVSQACACACACIGNPMCVRHAEARRGTHGQNRLDVACVASSL